MKSVVPLATTPQVSTTPKVIMMTITLMILTVSSRQRWLASEPESFSGGSTLKTSHRFVSGTTLRRLPGEVGQRSAHTWLITCSLICFIVTRFSSCYTFLFQVLSSFAAMRNSMMLLHHRCIVPWHHLERLQAIYFRVEADNEHNFRYFLQRNVCRQMTQPSEFRDIT